jgi:hypothetical protein
VNVLANKPAASVWPLAGMAALAFGLASTTLPAAPPPVKDPPETRQVSGRVLAPDGKPVPGAKLFTFLRKAGRILAPADVEFPLLGTADGDGRFTVSAVPAGKLDRRSFVIAYAPGFGLDWLQFDEEKDTGPLRDQTLRLTEDLPITGRVVDAKGRAVPGVSVVVDYIFVPADKKLDSYLAPWSTNRRDIPGLPGKFLVGPLNRVVDPTTTDPDGRFTLRGVGAERCVDVVLTGGGIARTKAHVITRRGLDPRPNEPPLNEIYKRLNLRIIEHLYGPELTVMAEAGNAVSGVITDAATGEPVPGCGLVSPAGKVFSTSRTDARGRYRLDGLRKKDAGLTLFVHAPEGTDYLGQNVRVDNTAGHIPVPFDLRLVKGSVVTGRVVDKRTGKGVRALIHAEALPDNKLYGSKPEYGRIPKLRKETDGDGRFRLLAIPGPGVIVAFVSTESKYGSRFNPYRPAVPDQDHKERFQRLAGWWGISTAGDGLVALHGENAARVIDVKETGETKVELSVDPGSTAQIVVQDGDGRPLTGTLVSGLAVLVGSIRLTEATATVYALDAKRPRTLALYHAERKLGGIVTVRGDEKQPFVAKLAPLGRVTGRLIDPTGKPLAGATVSCDWTDEIALALYQDARPENPVETDKDGRFTFEDRLPALSFRLTYRQGKQEYIERMPAGALRVKAGATLDLGDLTLQPAK